MAVLLTTEQRRSDEGRKVMLTNLRTVIGLADCCELLGIAWAFPTEELVNGIQNDAFCQDAQAAMIDAGIAETAAQTLVGQFKQSCDSILEAENDTLFDTMRHAYTRLFLTPGGHTPVFPFESAFLFAQSGTHGVPTLFVSRTTADVEHCMRQAGVQAKNARKEPADAIWNEFAYLAFVFGSLAQALQSEDEAVAQKWVEHATTFLEKHALAWLPDFMEKTVVESQAYEVPPVYASLAEMSKPILDALKACVK